MKVAGSDPFVQKVQVMTSARELFESEIPGTFAAENSLVLRNASGDLPTRVPLRHHIDFESRSRHIALFIPDEVPAVPFLTNLPRQMAELLKVRAVDMVFNRGRGVGSVGQSIKVENLLHGNIRMNLSADGLVDVDMDTLPFTGRIMVYSPVELTCEERDTVNKCLSPFGLHPWFRGTAFAAAHTAHTKPLAFVSHDSRDKPDIVRPLVDRLKTMLIPVWYDEFSLKVGASLRETIENGLRTCPKCILVLTPNFLGKSGWPKREFTSVFTRELVEDSDVILPISAGVDRDAVFAYSPILADKVGLQWSAGIDEVARALFNSLVRKGGPPYSREP